MARIINHSERVLHPCYRDSAGKAQPVHLRGMKLPGIPPGGPYEIDDAIAARVGAHKAWRQMQASGLEIIMKTLHEPEVTRTLAEAKRLAEK